MALSAGLDALNFLEGKINNSPLKPHVIFLMLMSQVTTEDLQRFVDRNDSDSDAVRQITAIIKRGE